MVGSARAHVGVRMCVCRGVRSHHKWCLCTAKGRRRTSLAFGATEALQRFSKQETFSERQVSKILRCAATISLRGDKANTSTHPSPTSLFLHPPYVTALNPGHRRHGIPVAATLVCWQINKTNPGWRPPGVSNPVFSSFFSMPCKARVMTGECKLSF